MAVIERTYTIPLRREWLKVQRYKRAKKAVAGLRKFLCRHMKSEDVLIGRHLNLELWKHGIRNPPSRVKVNVTKDEKGVVKAELFGAPVEKTEAKESKKEAKKEEKKEETKDVKASVTKEASRPAEEKPAAQKKVAAKKSAEEKPAATK